MGPLSDRENLVLPSEATGSTTSPGAPYEGLDTRRTQVSRRSFTVTVGAASVLLGTSRQATQRHPQTAALVPAHPLRSVPVEPRQRVGLCAESSPRPQCPQEHDPGDVSVSPRKRVLVAVPDQDHVQADAVGAALNDLTTLVEENAAPAIETMARPSAPLSRD